MAQIIEPTDTSQIEGEPMTTTTTAATEATPTEPEVPTAPSTETDSPAIAPSSTTTERGAVSNEAPATAATTTTGTEHAAAAAAGEEENVDPAIAPLKAMFPDFDDFVLHSILDSVSGDQERAIELLLGMSDPSYVPQTGPPATQEDLDEQLARRLALEEEQQHFNQRQRQHPSWSPQNATGQQVPYRPRVRGAPGAGEREPELYGPGDGAGAQGAPGDRDVFNDLGDSFNKIAETGKKTFSSLFSKAKQKLAEFDQGGNAQRQQQQQQQAGTTPSWGASSGSGPPGQWQSAPSQQQGQYYDPTPTSNNQLAHAQGAEGYDVSIPARGTPSRSSTTSSGTAATQPVGITATPPPPATQMGAPSPPAIDGSKLGMLPRRPVSLTSPQPITTGGGPPPDDDDELEYVENPFEERR